jgi:ABC-type branched-subunit amino acid transport system substrate-binding protein
VAADYKKAQFAKCGKTLGTTIFVPFTATDILPYVTQLSSQAASDSRTASIIDDGLFGSQNVAFFKAAQQTGLYNKYFGQFQLGTTFQTDAAAVAPNIPKTYWMGEYAYQAWDTPVNKRLINAMQKRYNKTPAAQNANGYRSMLAMVSAIRKAESTEPGDVATALEGLKFNAPQGRVTINKSSHQANVGFASCLYEGTKADCKIVKKVR